MKRDDLFAGYEQGQADMLAKCIAVVEACGDGKGYVYSDNETGIQWALDALRALQERQVDTPNNKLIEHINLEKP